MEKVSNVETESVPDLLALSESAQTVGGEINASGHRQELQRNFKLLALCGVAITTGNSWLALGGTIVVGLYNGGSPGLIYEFIMVSFFYCFIAASIAELASAVPSSSGGSSTAAPECSVEFQADATAVYHWATLTAGRYGRPCGWFAGWWNFLGWIAGCASLSAILGNQTVAMYAAFHANFVFEKWHILVGYLICTWLACGIVLFANRVLPLLATLGIYLTILGVLVTIIVCAIMPHVRGVPYTPSASVWSGWDNHTGYSNDLFVFMAGMINGAYAVGACDCVSHLAEEIPRPSKNLPKAMGVQMVLAFVTAFVFLITLLYATTDLSVVGANGAFPLAEIYRQVTGSRGGSLGLLIVAFIPSFLSNVGIYIITGRMFWTLARDNATPFSPVFARVSPRFRNPFNATVLCGVICTLMGCMYVGSSTAFNAFVSCYVQLSTLSYLAAILPHLLSGRSNVAPGWFWMRGAMGFFVNLISCLYIVVFIVIFSFPYSYPTTASSMNYTSLITGGLSLFVAVWWYWNQAQYVGPRYIPDTAAENLTEDAIEMSIRSEPVRSEPVRFV